MCARVSVMSVVVNSMEVVPHSQCITKCVCIGELWLCVSSVCGDGIAQVPMGGTDCAQPMIYAKKKKLEVDVFIVYTDCETWTGI